MYAFLEVETNVTGEGRLQLIADGRSRGPSNQKNEMTGTKPEEIGDAVIGCALQVGENHQMGGRQPVLLAGLPPSVPAVAIERQVLFLNERGGAGGSR